MLIFKCSQFIISFSGTLIFVIKIFIILFQLSSYRIFVTMSKLILAMFKKFMHGCQKISNDLNTSIQKFFKNILFNSYGGCYIFFYIFYEFDLHVLSLKREQQYLNKIKLKPRCSFDNIHLSNSIFAYGLPYSTVQNHLAYSVII